MTRSKTRIKTIPQTFLENPIISLAAKGLFAYLNCTESTYKIDPKDIATASNDSEEDIISYLGELMREEIIQFLEDGTFVLIDSKHSKEKVVNMENVKRVIRYWNTKGVINVRKETPALIHRIEKTLGIYTYEEIVQGINNYDTILNSKITWWDYRWTLEEFLKREGGLQVFLYKEEKDYLDRDAIKNNPKAKEIVSEEKKRALEQEKEEKEKESKKLEEDRKISAEKKQKLLEAWKTIPIDHKEVIDKITSKNMEKYEGLKGNIPALYEDYRKQMKLKQTEEYMRNPSWYIQEREKEINS